MTTFAEDIAARGRALFDILGQSEGRGAGNPEKAERWFEAVKRGCIFFYEEQEVKIGLENIDWSGGHIAHQEWCAQLNRFYCLAPLGHHYDRTGDEEAPRLARCLIEDWINHHDYGAGKPLAPGDNSLNLGVRMGQSVGGGWFPALMHFAGSPHFDDTFVQRMVDSAKGQLDALREIVPTKGGNWRISHVDALLTCGMLVDDLDAHSTYAVRTLNKTFVHQIDPDGSHIEHNPGYHSWMCEVFTRYWRLSQARPDLGLSIETEKTGRMWNYYASLQTPDGGLCGLHDSSWKRGQGREKVYQKRQAFLDEANLSGEEWDFNAQPSRHYPSAGQLLLHSGQSPEDEMVVFDATRWGGGHCHLSRNAVNLYAGGRMLLYDPGIFNYDVSDPFMSYGKSTLAHNTITFEGMSQSSANPDLRGCAVFEDAAVFASHYEGGYFPGEYTWGWYEGHHPGVAGSHCRTLLWLKGDYALVLDYVKVDRSGQHFAAHWQFPVGGHGLDAEAGRAWSESGKTNILVQATSATDALMTTVAEGQMGVRRGWLPSKESQSPDHQPAPQAIIEGNAKLGYSTLVTVLKPFAGEFPPSLRIEVLEGCEEEHTQAYRLDWGDGREDLVAESMGLNLFHGAVGRTARLDSDAALVHVTVENGKATRIVMYAGSYVELDGRIITEQDCVGNYSLTLS